MNYVVKIHRSCQNGWKTLNKTAKSYKSQKAGNAKRCLNQLTKFSILLKFSGNSYIYIWDIAPWIIIFFQKRKQHDKNHKIHCTISLLSLSLTNSILVLLGMVLYYIICFLFPHSSWDILQQLCSWNSLRLSVFIISQSYTWDHWILQNTLNSDQMRRLYLPSDMHVHQQTRITLVQKWLVTC